MSAPINPPIVTFDAFPIERIDLRESLFSLSLLFYDCFLKHELFFNQACSFSVDGQRVLYLYLILYNSIKCSAAVETRHGGTLA